MHGTPMGSDPFDQLKNRNTFRLATECKVLLCLRRSTDLSYISRGEGIKENKNTWLTSARVFPRTFPAVKSTISSTSLSSGRLLS
jgi:hypothetical protein